MKVLNLLEKELLKNKKFIDEDGKLLKSAIQTSALNLDRELIEVLLGNSELEKSFFIDVKGIKVFDKVKFSWAINNSEFLPDSFTSFTNKIGLADSNNNFVKSNKDVILSFPYKDCVLEFDSTSEDEDRDEVFLNEILAGSTIDALFEPKVLTNPVKHDGNNDEKINIFDNDNLVIKGNNLIAMHSLLSRYEGKIKFMYWDILYNTNSDNVPYNDKFKHSSWLTMMKNRLEVAKDLLSADGVICLQCDDNEQAYLTVLCDEIFGRDNRVNICVIEMASTGGLKRSHKDKRMLKTKEYILIYQKDSYGKINCLYDEWEIYDGNYTIMFDEKNGITPLSDRIEKLNPIYKSLKATQYLGFSDIYKFLIDNRNNIYRRHGPSSWAKANLSKGTVLWEDKSKTTRNQVIKVFNDDGTEYELLMRINGQSGQPNYERLEPLSWNFYDGKFKLLRGDLWKNYYKYMGNVNKEGGVKLSNGKKPEKLLYDLLTAFTNEDDIVLDSYFGTGTTGAVALKMNRKFIGIEQLDSHYQKSIERLKNVINGDNTGVSDFVNWNGGGTFVTVELMKQNENLINEILKAGESELDNIYEKLTTSPFVLNYKVDLDFISRINKDDDYIKLLLDDKKKVLSSLLDKNMIYCNKSEINDVELNVSREVKDFNKSFYGD